MSSVRDSTFSYVHLDNPNRVLYMEKWRDDSIPFDAIDTQQLLDATSSILPFTLLDDEEEDGSIPLQPATLGANLYKKRTANKDKTWSDLGIRDKFINEGLNSNPSMVDRSLLGFLRTTEADGGTNQMTVAEYLSNGFQISDNNDVLLNSELVNDSTFSVHHGDFFINSTASEAQLSNNNNNNGGASANNTSFQPLRSSSIGTSNHQGIIQTPRVGRTRQASNDRIFQTPITRIMR
ncbi:hypothetical protein DFJ63DRAFT_338678 [Scheffersomyces coipomensis]|uniref:uncharacterized protein n=1 Tax=Scheffersomyces coipomensis TaxID=1788519 RepID=UPI00315D8AF9